MENKDEQEVRIPKIRRRIAIVALIVSVLVVITVPLAVSLPKVFKGSDKAEGPTSGVGTNEGDCKDEIVSSRSCLSSEVLQTRIGPPTPSLLYTTMFSANSQVFTATSVVSPTPTTSSSVVADSCTPPSDPKEANCSFTLVSIDSPVEVYSFSGHAYGVWMRDPSTLKGNGTIFVMKGGRATSDKLFTYSSIVDLKKDAVNKTYNLPYSFDGTGAVIYEGYLYYIRTDTKRIIKYDLQTEKTVNEFTIEGFIPGKSFYSFKESGMDLAVDELGVWVLWGSSHGFQAALLDPCTNSTVHSWNVTTTPMERIGNAFVICGVIYTINKYNNNNAKINFAFDTKTGQQWGLDIDFINKHSYNTMVDYNPRGKQLYSWDNEKLVNYPLVLNSTGNT